MKAKASKVIYAVSFIPLMWCIIMGICYGSSSSAGFLENFGFAVLMFTVVIPLLPVCLIIQIVCLILINKKEHSAHFKRNIIITAAITVGVCGGSALIIFGDSLMLDIERFFERRSAINMLKNAEEKMYYSENEFYGGGAFGIDELRHDTMLIDYDKNEVGFIYDNSIVGRFRKVRLTPEKFDNSYKLRSIREKYFVQSDVPLNAPGKRLITFCEEENTVHRTIAMILETEDGFFYADDLRDKDTGFSMYNKFNRSDYYVGKGVRYADL